MPAPVPLSLALLGCSLACAGPPPCAGWSEPAQVGQVADPEVTEASGLAASRTDADLLWTHDDRGSAPVLYALGADGRARGRLSLTGQAATDWEDLALGVGPAGEAALYVGDIGDNDATRAAVRVLRLAEPAAPAGEAAAGAVDALELTWPGGPVDAEALGFDPTSNRLVLATKEKGRARLYQADAHAAAGSRQALAYVGEVDLSGAAFEGGRKVTALDLSPDGRRLLLRTAVAVLVYERAGDEPLDALLRGPACLAPAPPEPRGEALAATATGFLTVSEGAASPVWQVEAP